METTSSQNHDDEKIVVKNDITVEPVKNGNIDVGQNPPMERNLVRTGFVVFASFICNGLIFGLINSVSVIYKVLQARLESQNVEDASTKASLVGALAMGMTFLLSPVAGILTDRIGIRATTFLGGFLAAGGLLASAFLTHTVEALYLTDGVLFGIGASLAYTPSLVILGHYFSKYLGVANGFVTAGSSVFTLFFPDLLDFLINKIELEGCFQVLAGLMSVLMACALVFKPVHKTTFSPAKKRHNHTFKSRLRTIINVEIWRKKKFVIWAIAMPVALFGYFVSFVHLTKFVDGRFPGKDGKILIQCMAITSLLGRLVFGKLADFKRVDRILLQQISFVCMGVLTMLIVVVNDFNLLIAIALGMGIFDGCFISLIGPIAFEICGQNGASQAIGFLLGLCATPVTLGPPMAGYIYDKTQSYTAAFVASGVMPLLAALIMCLMRCVTDKEVPSPDPVSQPLRADVDSHENNLVSNHKVLTLEPEQGPMPPPPSYSEAIKGNHSNGAINHIDPSMKAVLTKCEVKKAEIV